MISTVVFCERTCKGEELPMILESAQIIIIATIAIYLLSMVLVGVYFSKKGSSALAGADCWDSGMRKWTDIRMVLNRVSFIL